MAALRTVQADAPLIDFALAPSGAEMAAVLRNGRTQVWSIAGKPLRSWASGDRPIAWILYAGEKRIVAGVPGSVMVLDASSGARRAGWEAANLQWVASPRDGSLLAAACGDGTVKLWKTDGELLRILPAKGLGEIWRVAVSPRGGRIASAEGDGDIRLFNGGTGVVEHVLDLVMTCFALDFSPDGRTLAAGSVDGSVTLWDADTGRAKGTLGSYPTGVKAVKFSSDGKLLASTSLSVNPPTAEAEAKVWDIANRKETKAQIGISTWNAVGFGPDGRPFLVDIHGQTISLRDLA